MIFNRLFNTITGTTTESQKESRRDGNEENSTLVRTTEKFHCWMHFNLMLNNFSWGGKEMFMCRLMETGASGFTCDVTVIEHGAGNMVAEEMSIVFVLHEVGVGQNSYPQPGTYFLLFYLEGLEIFRIF